MFTADDMRGLLNARPFVAFRIVLSDGGTVEVRSQEVVTLGRRFALVGLLDPNATDTLFDRWTVAWYMHVTRVEMLDAGAPPFAPFQGPRGAPTPT